MKKACLVVSAPYTNGEIFNRANTVLNRDNGLAFFHLLKDFLAQRGVDLNTSDINDPKICDIVIYNEMPKELPTKDDVAKSTLLLFESELIRSDNWDIKSHSHFSKIFTWHDQFVDNKKYFKMNFTHSGQVTFIPFESKTGFCTLIAGNKDVSHKLELYSERKKTIRWFEEHHPEDFEFYGMGWDQHTFTGSILKRALNKIPGMREAVAENWPSYKGRIDSKLAVLKNYKFSICYENAKDIPGYITEKIFDCLAAGCIPVYWGAPNITQYVDEKCFIDRTKFVTHEELYAYLKNMSGSEYNARLESIAQYLNSEHHRSFTPVIAAKRVAQQILSGST